MTIPHLRWGILGTGNIARKFATGLLSLRGQCTLAAVGSRSAASAEAFAAAHGGGCRAHGSYQALLDDPGVDVVYISLLNHQHAEWAIRAAEAGKHILCEKPATMTARELEDVLKAVAARDVFFMEGFLYRCHPRWATLRALLAAGEIGELRLLQACFSINGGDRWDGRLLDRAQGGGGLMDVGCYAVSWLRWMAGAEPVATNCLAHVGATGVDEWAAGQLLFPGGLLSTFATGVRVALPTVNALYGATGWIEVTEPWRGTVGKAAFIVRRDGAEPRTVTVPDDGLITHAREALEVARHVHARQSPAMSWADSLGQARTLDALRAQAGVRWASESG